MKSITNEQVDILASKGVEVFEIAKEVRGNLEDGSYVGITVENGSELLVFKDCVLINNEGGDVHKSL